MSAALQRHFVRKQITPPDLQKRSRSANNGIRFGDGGNKRYPRTAKKDNG
jgi:hypothetical protein